MLRRIVSWRGTFVMAGSVLGETGLPGHEQFDISIRISSDGQQWTDLAGDQPGFRGAIPLDLAAGADRLVLLGMRDPQSNARKLEVWTSEDGQSWRQGKLSGLEMEYGLEYGESHLIASSQGFMLASTYSVNSFLFSRDGLHWRSIEPDRKEACQRPFVDDVATYGAAFYAVGHLDACTSDTAPDPAAWWSPDGMHWHRSAIDCEGICDLSAVWATSGGGAVAQGSCCASYVMNGWGTEGSIASTFISADGSGWRRASSLSSELVEPLPGAEPEWVVASAGGRVVALNRHTAAIHESLDGISWREVTAVGAPEKLQTYVRVFLVRGGMLVVDQGDGDFQGSDFQEPAIRCWWLETT